jgi:hypothetical protein
VSIDTNIVFFAVVLFGVAINLAIYLFTLWRGRAVENEDLKPLANISIAARIDEDIAPARRDTLRYVLFCGSDEHPAGGWRDRARPFATIAEASETGKRMMTPPHEYNWWHVVDLAEFNIVKVGACLHADFVPTIDERLGA